MEVTERQEQRKRDILDSAFRIWGRNRYRSTSLSDLAADMDVKKQALYRYFPSKEKLEMAMEERVIQRHTAYTEELIAGLEEAAPEEILEDYVRRQSHHLKQNDRYLAFLAYRHRRGPGGIESFRRLAKELVDAVAEKTGIPATAIRYLNSLIFHETKRPGGGKLPKLGEPIPLLELFHKGFGTEGLDCCPDYNTLIAQASAIDFGSFGTDPLIEAVYQAVLDAGGSDVSLGSVAKKAGMTKSSLYNYWPSKEAMLEDVLQRQTKIYRDLYADFAGKYDRNPDRLFSYLAFVGAFLRRHPAILDYLQRILAYGVGVSAGRIEDDDLLLRFLTAAAETGQLDFRYLTAIDAMGLVNLAAIIEIKYHLTEGSVRIRFDQGLKDLYILITGGLESLKRTLP